MAITRLLDVLLSLALIFTLVSVLCAAVNELLAGHFSRRAEFLHLGLQRMVPDRVFFTRLMNHPLLTAGGSGNASKPSYLAGEIFAYALVDVMRTRADLMAGRVKSLTVASPTPLSQVIHELEQRDIALAAALRTLLAGAADETEIKKRIGTWYDQTMERVSGQFKRHAQKCLFVIGFLVAAAIDVDTIAIAKVLWTNPARATAVAEIATRMERSGKLKALVEGAARHDGNTNTPPEAAEKFVGTSSSKADAQAMIDKVRLALDEVAAAQIPISHHCMAESNPIFACWANLTATPGKGIFAKLLGWLLTALAISMGAPFWFELLSKLVNLRSAGVKPPRKSENGSAA